MFAFQDDTLNCIFSVCQPPPPPPPQLSGCILFASPRRTCHILLNDLLCNDTDILSVAVDIMTSVSTSQQRLECGKIYVRPVN